MIRLELSQLCSNGPVAERRKYGAPTLHKSNNKINGIGDSLAVGFHSALGAIGKAHIETISKKT